MSSRENRGGYRQPASPAAVSNPQSGARTDGGAGSRSQPLRVPTGGAYGEAKALTEQQQGAPMAAGGGAPAGPPPGGGGGGVPPPAPGVFGPSSVQGAPPGITNDPTQLMAQNPQAFLRVLASKFPHPSLRRLVDWSAIGSNPPRGTGGYVPEGPPTTMSQRTGPTPPPQGRPPNPPTSAPGVATAETMSTPGEVAEGF